MAGGQGGDGLPNLFKVVEFSEVLMFRRTIFRLLLLIKIKVLNFIGTSLNLTPPPPPPLFGATTPLVCNFE